MKKHIAFTGWAGSGKTQAARYTDRKYGYQVISFADGIKMVATEIFDMQGKSRKLLQDIGETLRIVDSDVWVKHTLRRVTDEYNFAIDDLRRLNEYAALIQNDFMIVRIVADEDIRIKRLIERDGQCDTSLLYNESESGCQHIVLPQIFNNGSLEELYEQIDAVVRG